MLRIRSDEALFRRVRARRGTIVWPLAAGGIDIDPDVLIWGGPAPADGHSRPVPLLELSLLTAAISGYSCCGRVT